MKENYYNTAQTGLSDIADAETDFIKYHDILSRAGKKIDEITKNSENDFLKIGNQLSGYLHGSKNLYETSVLAASSISKHILQDGVAPLSVLMKEFSGYLSGSSIEIRKDISSLREISGNIEKILIEQEGFNKIVKTLKMLGISTKIESVRLGTDEQGFYVLAENVDKLSTLISDKSKLISDKSNLLLKTIANAMSNLKVLSEEQDKHSGSILNHTTHSISNLESKYTHCSGKVSQISDISRLVSKNVQGMVTSIQFHDITRQQMEHVKEVVEEQIKVIENASMEKDEDVVLNLMDTVVCACDLQKAQLTSSSERFYGAVTELAAGLTGIEANVSRILAESCALLNEQDKSGRNPLKDIQSELSLISESLKENMEISNSLSASIMNVIAIVEDLSEYIADIQSIGDEIEIIALNSRVKAARAGSEGSALGVLSESIQKLSIDAKNQSDITAKILDEIGSSSQKLKESIESISGAERKDKMLEIDESISKLINSTIVIEGETQSLIEKLRSMVAKMKYQIASTLEQLNIHEFVRNSVEKIVNEINEISSSHPAQGVFNSSREEKTKKFLSLYTMHSERNVHKSFASNGAAGKKQTSEDDGFDSNIELF